jgi:hypothetical protein
MLLVIGMSKEVVRYLLWDINILAYSGLSDILLSPLEVLQENYFVILLPPFVLLSVYVLLQTAKEMRTRRIWYKGLRKRWIFLLSRMELNWAGHIFIYFSFVIGIGVGGAVNKAKSVEKQIATKTLVMSHQLAFRDQETLTVSIIGQNHDFIFYVIEGSQEISISPIEGNVKRITPLKNATAAPATPVDQTPAQ